jgi:hypothetical protein
MRPHSILMFERLFLGSLALSTVASVLAYDDVLAELERDPAMAQLGLGGGFLVGMLALGMAIFVLLWFLIARKASRVAKWILVVFVAVGLASLAVSLADSFTPDVNTLLSLSSYALEVAAVVYLFHADAVAWLRGEAPADPATFD